MKEIVHRESHVPTDKPFASPAVFNSPSVSPAPESSPTTQLRSSLDGSFRSPFLVTAPPDVFSSPSVKFSNSTETSRRRPSPFPYHHEHSKKLKLDSSDLPDSGSSPPEPNMSQLSVTNNTSPSQSMLSPLSPIREPTTEENSTSVLSQIQSMSPELNALLTPEIDSSEVSSSPRQVGTPDCQVNSSDPQMSSPGCETPSSMTATPSPHQSASDQPQSQSITSSPSYSPLEGSPPPEPHRQTPLLPESPASYFSPLVSSPPPELHSLEEPVEPEIHRSSPTHQQESEVGSSTTVPASIADSASSVSSCAEAKLVDEDSEVESGEKAAESSAEVLEACSVTEVSCSTSAKGLNSY